MIEGTWRGAACSSCAGLWQVAIERSFGLSAEGVASNAPGHARAPPIQAGSLCYFAFGLDRFGGEPLRPASTRGEQLQLKAPYVASIRNRVAAPRALRATPRWAERDRRFWQGDIVRHGSDGRRRSADAELWRPSCPTEQGENRGGVGSLVLLPHLATRVPSLRVTNTSR